MNPLFSVMIIVLVVFVAIAMILSFSNPAVQQAQKTTEIKEAEDAMKLLDSFITETSREGAGSVRIARLDFSGSIQGIAEEDAFQKEETAMEQVIEPFSRVLSGNLITISGNDVSCSTGNNLVMENSFLRAEFQNIPRASPHSSITTSSNIIRLKEKTLNTEINLTNSSIVIDGNVTSHAGTGYSEILSAGENLPVCIVHFFVNSTPAVYDAYYSLYAGADFLVLEVRNVR
jgi:hypothetical protein